MAVRFDKTHGAASTIRVGHTLADLGDTVSVVSVSDTGDGRLKIDARHSWSPQPVSVSWIARPNDVLRLRY